MTTRQFIIKNYYGTTYSDLIKGSYFKASPKIFLTFILYGILKILITGPFFFWLLDIPFILAIFVQFFWCTPFFGLSYYDKHPLTDNEKKWLEDEKATK